MGMCHIDGTLIGGAGNSLMSGGPGVFSNDIAIRLTTLDIQAAKTVYSWPLDPGAFRDEFEKFNQPDTTLPTISITSPTASPSFTTVAGTVDLAGSASDNVVVMQVTWENDRGGSGTGSGTTSWTANNIALQSGSNVITVTAHDFSGNTQTDTITVTFNPNIAPVATNDDRTMFLNRTLTVSAPGVLANDTDADGDTLVANLVSGPANGSVSLSADGGFSYTPNTSFRGSDSFTYRANDGVANSNLGTVAITVNNVSLPWLPLLLAD
jgi:hypothetical protein